MSIDAAGQLHGELTWNIKSRFREYVRSLPDGTEQWLNGTGRIEPQEIIFAFDDASSFDPDSGLGTIKYGGSVRFAGYRGALRVDISDPWVEMGAQHTRVTVDISPKGLEPNRIVIAAAKTVSAVDNGRKLTWSDVPTALTAEGSALLGNVYPPGSDADPLSYWLPRSVCDTT